VNINHCLPQGYLNPGVTNLLPFPKAHLHPQIPEESSLKPVTFQRPRYDRAADQNVYAVSELLVELRLKIWKHAVPRPVLLKVWPNKPTEPNNGKDKFRLKSNPLHFKVWDDMTGVFRACKESRSISLAQLPYTLPSGNRAIEIRFHPDTIIHVVDFSPCFITWLYQDIIPRSPNALRTSRK